MNGVVVFKLTVSNALAWMPLPFLKYCTYWPDFVIEYPCGTNLYSCLWEYHCNRDYGHTKSCICTGVVWKEKRPKLLAVIPDKKILEW